ncbi:conserved hypothetical protein [Frankia sp. AiPs1]|uniref:hypothetical protein n=1 Tax=Frankia sp. AiPa1 TaxID=573492 RepID=UPI00202B25B4|nr:hypothetical protein [Frankia sp. AiPa1]MCL9762209.1 hypothetical protein [Frankia sp. AiPa1]
MDALKRGWIGLALFCAALVLMPILVLGYEKDTSAADQTHATSVPASATVAPTGTANLRPALAFAGVQQNDLISGFRVIQVDSLTYAGPLSWVLNGPLAVPFQINVARPPYIFSPGSDGGWQTGQAPDGRYTLTAIPTGAPDKAITVVFTVRNQSGALG